MKSVFISLSLMMVSATALASPRVAGSFVNVNAESCVAIANLADACQMAMANTQKLKAKISALNPQSSDYKKLSELLPQMQSNEDFICETVKRDQKIEMAVATLNLDGAMTVPASRLDKGILGKIEFSPSQTAGDSIKISSPTVKMTVYGNVLCQAVVKAGGNFAKALETLAAEVAGQN